MINTKYQLVRPYLFRKQKSIISLSGKVLVSPLYLSICAADLRYYQGQRNEEVLKDKLPMVLIHEAIGEVVFDDSGKFEVGEKVVMIPNQPTKKDLDYKENYDRTSLFRSSSADGFLQEYIAIDTDRLISVDGIDLLSATMIELLSVVFNAIDDCKYKLSDNSKIGVWGNGNLGYLTILVLRYLYPKSEIYLYGRNDEKNLIFKDQNKIFNINQEEVYENPIDVAFECVGGTGSGRAINQIIDVINPQGHISLLGVSETFPEINTRMVLEKGLTLQGSSRSGYQDFYRAVSFLNESKAHQESVKRLITEVISVSNVRELKEAFDKSISNNFKTVIEMKL